MSIKLQAVFLDRDGTIGGTGHFIHPRDFTLFPFAAEALQMLRAAGFKLFAFTNQHRISLGQATLDEFAAQFEAFGFDDAYICPHSVEERCDCRKPAPGMLLRAAAEHGLDLTRCAVIGDVGATDMLAAHAVGAVRILVRTGWGEGSLGPYRDEWASVEPAYIATDLLDAARWLIRTYREPGEGESA